VLLVCVVVMSMMVSSMGLPSGFLMGMVPDKSASNHLWAYQINPTTGVATPVGDDYVMASLANTPNGGTYNAALKQIQFIGQSLTASNDPNPTMQFLVTIDAAGEWMSKRLISFGGQVLTARSDSNGVVYGMEQNTPGTDAKIDLIDDAGRCNPVINTTATAGYLVGHAAIDSANQRFYVSVKNSAGGVTLLTADLQRLVVMGSADLPVPGSTRVTLCYDTTQHALYSLERLPGTTDSTLLRVDANSGHTDVVATIKGKATTGDCRAGTFFVGGVNGGQPFLSVVDLPSGKTTTTPISINPALLVFFPQ